LEVVATQVLVNVILAILAVDLGPDSHVDHNHKGREYSIPLKHMM